MLRLEHFQMMRQQYIASSEIVVTRQKAFSEDFADRCFVNRFAVVLVAST